MSIAVSSLVCLLAASPPALRTRVAVLDLRSSDTLKPVARQASEAILLELAKNPNLVAMSQSEIDVLVAHAKDKEEIAACDGKESCLAKLSEIVDAEKLISGHVGTWGSGYLVTLALSNVKQAIAEKGESCTVEHLDELGPEVGRTVQRLFGVDTSTTTRFELAIVPGGTKLAVLDLVAYDTRAELAASLTQLLALELKKFSGLSVISRDEIQTMLQYEASKQIIQCKEDIACLIEIGGALGVEYLVSGGIGKLEDAWVIHLKLMNVPKAEVAHRISETFRGPERNLAQAIRFATWALLGRTIGGRGAVSIITDAEDARASIDGQVTIELNSSRRPPELPAGKHVLAVRADGYFSLEQDFYVEDRQMTAVRADLIELPREWYEEWWPWAIITGVVAAGVTTSLIVANQSEGSTPVVVTFE